MLWIKTTRRWVWWAVNFVYLGRYFASMCSIRSLTRFVLSKHYLFSFIVLTRRTTVPYLDWGKNEQGGRAYSCALPCRRVCRKWVLEAACRGIYRHFPPEEADTCIKERFASRIGIIVRPLDADIATLRGAAQYGMSKKQLMSSVIAPRSYMIKVCSFLNFYHYPWSILPTQAWTSNGARRLFEPTSIYCKEWCRCCHMQE